jgi:hypothetical protein
MGYVIVREEDGRYVAPPGQENSYTDRLEQAWHFATKAAALAQCCAENERVAEVQSLLRPAE